MKWILLLALGCSSLSNAQNVPTAAPVSANGADPAGILAKVASKYKSIDTYSSNGIVVSDIETAGHKTQITTTFSLKLKKPNLYLITWSQAGAIPQIPPQTGAVWSDGTQPYLYMGLMNAYSKIGNDESALGAATGISGGAAYTIPFLFLPAMADKTVAFSRLKDPIIEKSESIGGDDCYVLSGSSSSSKKETFWISKSSSFILKYERSYEPPAGGVVFPETTDEGLERELRATGQPVTDDSKKRMRDMMQRTREAFTNSNLKGTSTQTQTDISTPNLTVNDFHFTPPNGATLKDSILAPQSGFTTPTQQPSGASSTYETVEAPVIRVFSTSDGDNKFIAYLVQWKGADVIVSDPLGGSNLKVGDTIHFMAQKIKGPTFSSLSFTYLR